MSARQLYDAGFTDLVSVVPPKAELAPTTTLKPESRGKAPGIQRRDGLWVGYSWVTTDPPTEAQITKWDKVGANVGLAGDRFPGLDIDADHPALAKFVQQEAEKMLGATAVRTSREPRRLLVYRADEPFARIGCRITTLDGNEHVVEVLGKGRQYLVHGAHPSGSDYGWVGTPLWEIAPEQLPCLNPDKVISFYEHLRERLGGRVKSVIIEGTGETSDERAAPDQHLLEAPSIEALADVVAQIPNDYPDRDSYIFMGHAVKAAAGSDEDAGLDVWWEWCQRWEGGTNERDTVELDWRKMQPPYRVGWEWLQEQAAEYGEYIPAQDEFEAVPDAEPIPEKPEHERVPADVFAFTDAWVVEKIAGWLVERARYVPQTGHWHVWNGYAWEQDILNRATHLVRRSLVRLSHEVQARAERTIDEKESVRLFKVAMGLQSRSALTKTMPELEAHPKLTLRLDQFDADPWLLNTPGGIVDLTTGEVSEPDPGALMAKATGVAPGRGTPERWVRFIDEATGGDEELARFLQKQIGYALTGVTSEQTLSFIHGPPLTGKSVFVDTLGGMFGSYHETAPADTFAAAKGDRHPTDLAKLAGSRLVTASETQEGRAWDTPRIKSITGGDRISARFMRQDFFDYTPTFKVVIVGNHEPEIKGVDDALMRRLHVIPFENSPEEVDRLLPQKLEEEWPQILAWAIEGCLMWLDEGLTPPEAVRVRTERYREEEDPVGRFLDECCVFGGDEQVERSELYLRWRNWCRWQGEDPGTLKQLKRRFHPKEAKYDFIDTRLSLPGRPRGYSGLGLKPDEGEEFV